MMNEKQWYEEFEKIKIKQELVHERDNLIGELNEVQGRINTLNDMMRFTGVKE